MILTLVSISRTTALEDSTVSCDSKTIKFSGKVTSTKNYGKIRECGQPGFEVQQRPLETVMVSELHLQGRVSVGRQGRGRIARLSKVIACRHEKDKGHKYKSPSTRDSTTKRAEVALMTQKTKKCTFSVSRWTGSICLDPASTCMISGFYRINRKWGRKHFYLPFQKPPGPQDQLHGI